MTHSTNQDAVPAHGKSGVRTDKPGASSTSTWTAGYNALFRLEYRSSYDFSHAKLDEWYTLYQKRFTLFRKREKWVPVLVGAGEYSFPVRGDCEWAQRQSKNLNIDLPPPTHRLTKWKATEVRNGTN